LGGGGFGMEDALSYMFGGGDAAWMIRDDGDVMSAATGVTMTKDVVSSDRAKNNAAAIISICFGRINMMGLSGDLAVLEMKK
jgi:hypothetical protein